MLQRPYYNEQDDIQRQINTLKIFNENVIEIKENCEYRIDFNAGGRNMSLNVLLGPEFPNEKPNIFVNPVIPHPWLAENSNQILAAPGLLQYTEHSDLGRVVQAIIREFQKSLPNLKNHEDSVKEFIPQSVISEQSLLFPELCELTVEELQEILENTDLQDKLLETSQQIIELDLETDDVLRNIEDIAQANLSKQQVLDELKTDVIDRISTIVQMKINYEDLNRKHQQLCAQYSPHRIRENLREAAASADDQADHIAQQFLLGNIPVEAFISKFGEKRALGQARRAREERLAHQLAQLDRATT